jgi:hypothetical protein
MNLITSSIPASWIAIFVRRSMDPVINLLNVFPMSEAMLIAQEIVLKISPMKGSPLFDLVHEVLLSSLSCAGARPMTDPLSFTNLSMPSTTTVSFAGFDGLRLQSSTAEARFIHWSEIIVTLEDSSSPVGSKTAVMDSGFGMTIGVVIAPPKRIWRVVVCSEINVVTITTVGAWNVAGISVVKAWLPIV